MEFNSSSRASRTYLTRYGAGIDVSMVSDKNIRYLKIDWDKPKPVRLNEIDEKTLKVARESFKYLTNGSPNKASRLLNGNRQQVVELLATSGNPSVKNFLNNITIHAKRHCQNLDNEARFILQLLKDANLRTEINKIRQSPHENIAAIAERY